MLLQSKFLLFDMINVFLRLWFVHAPRKIVQKSIVIRKHAFENNNIEENLPRSPLPVDTLRFDRD